MFLNIINQKMFHVEKQMNEKEMFQRKLKINHINHNVVKIDTYRDINDTFELFLIIMFEYSNGLNYI